MSVLQELKDYEPYNELEAQDKQLILKAFEGFDDLFDRENVLAHMTASAWVTNKSRDKILMAYHNIYKSYAWLGGHCDKEEDCLKVAIKEVQEEAGIHGVKPISEKIFSIEVLPVISHIKKGKLLSNHLHLNVTYLLEADDQELLRVKEDENSAVKWFDKDEVLNYVEEKWMVDNVYSKLNKKMEEFNENN